MVGAAIVARVRGSPRRAVGDMVATYWTKLRMPKGKKKVTKVVRNEVRMMWRMKMSMLTPVLVGCVLAEAVSDGGCDGEENDKEEKKIDTANCCESWIDVYVGSLSD